MPPKTKIDLTTTNNSCYKRWISSPNKSYFKNRNSCETEGLVNYQTTYNYCYSLPGTYSEETEPVLKCQDLCV